jgi:hypothetical protein
LPKTLKRDNDGMIEAAIRQHFAALCRDWPGTNVMISEIS